MKFTKMQGAGNDFVLVETSDLQNNWSQTAIEMCDRHFGIGADGLLLFLPSDKANFRMRILDADGTEAEACGNGIRCIVKYAFEKCMIGRNVDRVLVETLAGIRTVKLLKTGNRLSMIQANMGKPELSAVDIPLIAETDKGNLVGIKTMIRYPVSVNGTDLVLDLVSMGNPHAVYFSDQPVSYFPLSILGPKVEHLSIFPSKINFEVARVLNRKQIEARVWERGVGETLACGSGACAIVVAARLLGYVDDKVDIELPGGILKIEWNGEGNVYISGQAEIVFTGDWVR